jgi:hypothetical protein
MRSIVVMALLLIPAALQSRLAAQEPSGPRPVQPARPLELPALQPPVADTGIFSAAPLPPASELRRADGAPGNAYWQQRVDYTIRVTLDTTERRINGTVTLQYTNNSPDTLRFVWMQVDQNLFRPGSTGSLLFASDSRFGGAGFEGGYEIDRVVQCSVPGRPRVRRRARRASADSAKAAFDCLRATGASPLRLRARVEETMMYMDLARPIPPRGTTILALAYAFKVPEHGADRMGRDGSLYEIAQWYPRMAVYDDVHGWNTDQYLGQGEFYLEYGNIDYEVTLPAGYIVAGTGLLLNPEQVLTPSQRERLAVAAKSDTTVQILTEAELRSGAARPAGPTSLTWRFRAQNVRDAAWAASPEYLWDASSWQGILVQAYYRPSALETWKDAARMSRFSIQEYSSRWFRYPYPQMSAIEGPVSGMEYPMVAMEARGQTGPDLFRVVTHEIGHSWYPMIVGSNERRYAWMDEGFDTFINTFAEEGYWSRDDSAVRLRERELVVRTDQMPTAQPIMTPANRYKTPGNLLSLAYVKPSIALLTLRNKVLAPAVFDSAFREYTRRWAFKHPQPADFFRTMEAISGRDLSWFWRGFFFTTAALDQAIDGVKREAGGPTQVVVANLGDAVMPVELLLTFDDGSTSQTTLPVEIWYLGDRYVYQDHSGKTVVRATVNPDGTFPDALTANDAWPAADTTEARTSSTNEGR